MCFYIRTIWSVATLLLHCCVYGVLSVWCGSLSFPNYVEVILMASLWMICWDFVSFGGLRCLVFFCGVGDICWWQWAVVPWCFWCFSGRDGFVIWRLCRAWS